MNKVGPIIGVKQLNDDVTPDKLDTFRPLDAAKSNKNIVEFEYEPFQPVASQVGEDNESIRNLLLDVENKVAELEIIRQSVVALVDPVNRTLRAFEETKSEKIGLQSAL